MGNKGLNEMNNRTPLFLFVLLCLMTINFAWWNTSYAYRLPINCTNVASETPIVINESNGFSISGNSQIVWTTCGGGNLSVYYNNHTDYIVANDTAQKTFEVELGNGTSHGNIATMWRNAGYVGVWHLGNTTDSAGYANLQESGTISYVSSNCKFGKCAKLGTQYSHLNTTTVSQLPLNSLTPKTIMIWGASTNATPDNYQALFHFPSDVNGERMTLQMDIATSKIAMAAYTKATYVPYSSVMSSSFYAGTVSGSTVSVYFNTTTNSSTPTAPTANKTTGTLFIGIWNGNANGWGSGNTPNSTIDEARIMNISLTAAQINQTYYNALGTAGYGTLGARESLTYDSVTFISQTPSDLTTTNAILGLNIQYNTTNVTSGTPFISYTVNSTSSNIFEYINGTSISGWFNKTRTSNTSTTSNFTLFDNDFLPATYNLNNSLFNKTHSATALVAQSNFISIQLFNVSNKAYGFFEVMAQGSNANPMEFFYCNSSYSFTLGTSVQTSQNCAQFGTLPSNTPYNHSHNAFSNHTLIPFAINTTSGNVLGTTVKVTSQSFFMVRGATATTTNIYYITNQTRVNTTQTTTNNGNAWTAQTYTPDAHLHQFNTSDTLYYKVFANISGTLNSSSIRNDTFNLDNLAPTPPIILTPTSENKYGYINITWLPSSNLTPSTFYYNISLLNPNLSFNKTINGNVSTNTSYNWNTAGTSGNYVIRVTVKDNYSLTSSDDSNNFTIATFTATSITPTSGQTFAGNEILFTYSQDSGIANANCSLRIDGSEVNSQIGMAGSYSYLATLANGSHYWFVNCSDTEGANYTYQSINRSFSINYYAFNTEANLTTSPENVLERPQALFFDINGNLNVLYFTDESTSRTLRIKTISGSTVINQANLTLEPTAQFFIAFRNANNTSIITLNDTNSTKGTLLTLNGNTLTQQSISFPSINALNITQHDPYTYANTKHFQNLSISASSYYLFITPLATGSNVTKWNGTNFSTVQTFVNSVSGQYQTIANNSALTQWLFIAPVNSGGNNVLHIYSYNGSAATDLATLDANAYSSAVMNTAIVGFERYENKTYAYATNITARTTIYLVEEAKQYQINESISNPSHFLFTDKYTFVFFAVSGGDTYAYTCYFESAPTCSKLLSSEYGVAVPYERGFLSSAKRETNRDDTVVRGMIQSGSVVALNYNINTYDMKFICYDEQNDARRMFKQRTYSSINSFNLINNTWGYVLPSASIGTGLKRILSTCTNGTERLFLTGLAGNFSIDEYTLNTLEGVYYIFTIKDSYGTGIQNAKVSMLRYSSLKQSFNVIEQCLSDFNGGCTFFLEPYTNYKILLEASGYTTQYIDYTPSSVTSVTITLDTSGQSFSLPNYNYLFNDLTTSLSPTSSLMHNSTDIVFTVASNNSTLEYYGMTIWRTINGTRTQVYTNNISTQPSGGSVLYNVNQSGTYDLEVWAKSQNFTLYDPFTRPYVFQIRSGLTKASEQLIGSNEFSGWSFYFLGVFVTMLVVGFVSRYTVDGAGVVGLIVLWGFTIMNPSAIIYPSGALTCAAAGAICITTTIASILTSIVVVSALYLRYSSQSGG
jgi:hypothetical protein